ncbi:hypothetical protein AB0B50_44145 [Streptomyces sp. NPDC041068]|uniref:hypothetical protein n=1 Tax=Streptomyces sp. NPDC041068 TaxID=3155130 RepID=UPI0033C81780
MLVPSVALVVLAAGVAIPLAVADSPAAAPCHQVPASVRALAGDPSAAAEALDPGDDLRHLGSARKLLAHETVCGDGAGVLGRVAEAATRSSGGRGEPHGMAQARSAYAVAALRDIELPEGLAPGVARMVAEYVVDAGRDDGPGIDDVTGPALPASQARLGKDGWVRLGRFLAPGEAHAAFEYADRTRDADADIPDLVAELAKDPEAFAILYDAERAYLAHYLERLTDQGGDPHHRPDRPRDKRFRTSATDWPDIDLRHLADRVGTLMKLRTRYAKDGTIPDLAAFDRAVREHSRGTYRPADRRLGTRPPMGDIADRRTAGPVRGDLMDGRQQLFVVFDAWAKERGVPDRRAGAMRQLLDDSYVRALWLRF